MFVFQGNFVGERNYCIFSNNEPIIRIELVGYSKNNRFLILILTEIHDKFPVFFSKNRLLKKISGDLKNNRFLISNFKSTRFFILIMTEIHVNVSSFSYRT